MFTSEISYIKRQTKMLIKLTVKYLNSILQTFLLVYLGGCFVQGFYTLLTIEINVFIFCLGDIMYFRRTFTCFFWRKKAIFTKLLIPCESSNKFPHKCKFLSLNNESILTYWPLKNPCFMFYRRDPATFIFLKSLNQISLISYNLHLSHKFKKMNW